MNIRKSESTAVSMHFRASVYAKSVVTFIAELHGITEGNTQQYGGAAQGWIVVSMFAMLQP
jgi:hypothetical protein